MEKEEIIKKKQQLINYLIELVPSMSLLKNKEWEKFIERFAKRMENVTKTENDNLSSDFFIDYLIGAYSKYNSCFRFVCAFNNEIEKARKISQRSKVFTDKINTILKNIFLTGDASPCSSNSDFKNRVNEICVFNFFSNCENFEISAMEEQLSNGKDIDFVLENKDTGECLGVDVVTFQNIDFSKHESGESFTKFVDKKIKDKYNSKIGKLTSFGRMGKIFIFPIIECDDLPQIRVVSSLDYAFPIHTTRLNTIDGKNEICLLDINALFINPQNSYDLSKL